MIIGNINELYQALKGTNYCAPLSEAEKKDIEDYLNTQLNKADNADFIAELNAVEQSMIQQGDPSLCYVLLEQWNFSPEFVLSILKHLTDTTLNQTGLPADILSCRHNVATPLGMAINGLTKRLDPDEINHGLYLGYTQDAIEFRDKVVHYLIDARHVSVDTAFIHLGHPLTVYCIQRINFCVDLYYPLAFKLIENIQNVNIQSKSLGLTSVHAAVLMNASDLLEKLLEKNPDLTLHASPGIFQGVARTALSIATEKGNTQCINLLLNAKASPNDMPAKNQIGKADDKILSPYQAAVEKKNARAIGLFQTYSKQNQVPLVSDLAPEEWQRRFSAGVFQAPGEATLQKQLEMMPFKDKEHSVESIRNNFGLNCYVQDLRDISTIERALNTLLGDHKAEPNPAFRVFEPIRQKFLEECRKNSDFSLFVQSSSNSETMGCYNRDTRSDMYIQGGLSYDLTLSTIAHELGHFFGFAQPESSHTMAPNGFVEAFAQDKKLWIKQPTHPRLQYLLDSIETQEGHYHNTFEKNAEYFTRVCVQFPMDVGLTLTHITQQEFDEILESSMPNTWNYFKSHFLPVKDVEAIAKGVGPKY